MGDGGGCHPRDNIALSWLSDELGLKFNWFDNIMKQREIQTEWFADLIEENIIDKETPRICILGKTFKPETNLITGSPATLLKNILEERGHNVVHYDPYVDNYKLYTGEEPCCYFIGTKHEKFTTWKFNDGSTILDPWRYIPEQDNCEVIHIGG